MKESLEVLNEFLKEIDIDLFYSIRVYESDINLQGPIESKDKLGKYNLKFCNEFDWYESSFTFKNKLITIILIN